MTTYLALFRGINIGGHNKISMKELVSVFEDLACRNIRTYIQSGNVIFDTNRRNRSKLTSNIRQAVEQGFGFCPKVLLLTTAELQEMIAQNPFPPEDGKALHFIFLEECPDNPDLDRLSGLKTVSEEFTLGEKVFYLYTPEGVGKSRLAKNIEKCLGVTATGRNWNTVSRLATMM